MGPAIRAGRFGSVLLSFSEIDSTNRLLLDLAAQGYPEGTVVQADSQTRGRGRQGRRWITPPGRALAFSLLLRPRSSPKDLPWVTLMAAVAVARCLETFRVRAGIKWPNDLLLNDKKVCGILTEVGPSRDNRPSIVLGVGLNVNQVAKDFPPGLRKAATSLQMATKRTWDRQKLLGRLLDHLEEGYEDLLHGRIDRLSEQWGKRNVTLGREVRLTQGKRSITGMALGLDRNGALLLSLKTGEVQRVLSGDVTFRAKGHKGIA
ncbi:MAG TPA: biotin--[acetyl-CoA-carboxylase] ligase [bacterium]|nr:biotin--[acetyl-CoA-carboxylase] ligase [bacterium]